MEILVAIDRRCILSMHSVDIMPSVVELSFTDNPMSMQFTFTIW